jgi:DNA-binding HxlR family transcriptional regulator
MLMQELKHLQVSELVERKADGDRVFYQLTEKGKLAFPLLEAMRNFARQYEDSLKKV